MKTALILKDDQSDHLSKLLHGGEAKFRTTCYGKRMPLTNCRFKDKQKNNTFSQKKNKTCKKKQNFGSEIIAFLEKLQKSKGCITCKKAI